MFENPYFNIFDFHHNSTEARTKSLFLREEGREIKRIVSANKSEAAREGQDLNTSQEQSDARCDDGGDHSPAEINQYTERQVRHLHLKEKESAVEYIGLISQTVFDEHGNQMSDIVTQSNSGPADGRRRRPLEARDRGDRVRHIVGSGVDRNFNIQYAGLDVLPRNTLPPRVIRDSPKTQKFYNSSKLSPSARSILRRTNYKLPLSLKYDRYDDDWQLKSLRLRASQVMVNILYLSMDRGDYERSWRILTSLLREPHVEARVMWMVALELLEWRDEKSKTTSDRLGDQFLDWLIINFPSRLCRPTRWRSRPRATDFAPFAVLAKLSRGATLEALDQIENLVMVRPYGSDPVCWALCGIAYSQAGSPEKSKRCFQRCIELGGIVPDFVRQQYNIVNSEDYNTENQSDQYSD